jgi:transposase-like protein
MSPIKYTKEILEPLVKESISIAEVLRKLGVRSEGGSHNHISKRIKEYGIDTSHILGQASARGKPSPNKKKKWHEILILKRSKNSRRESSYILRRALIESGRPYKCESCGQEPIWNGAELRLQVDHINRDWEDNRPENIRFLCPNCHTQTTGFNGSKGKSRLINGIDKRKPKSEWKKRRYPNRPTRSPSKEILEKLVWEKPTMHIAKEFGVSDVAVSKWCKKYKIEKPAPGYWAKKQAGKI